MWFSFKANEFVKISLFFSEEDHGEEKKIIIPNLAITIGNVSNQIKLTPDNINRLKGLISLAEAIPNFSVKTELPEVSKDHPLTFDEMNDLIYRQK